MAAGTYQFGYRATDNHSAQSDEDFVMATVRPVAATSSEVDLVIEGHSMAQYPNDYTECQQPFVDKANTTFAVNSFPNQITSVRNVVHSSDRLLGGATGMVAQYDGQVKGTSVAIKINVLALYWLSNQLAFYQPPGVASQATYTIVRDYVCQCKADDPSRFIITELLTPRSNPETVQPAFNIDCQKLNSLIKAGMASGDYPY